MLCAVLARHPCRLREVIWQWQRLQLEFTGWSCGETGHQLDAGHFPVQSDFHFKTSWIVTICIIILRAELPALGPSVFFKTACFLGREQRSSLLWLLQPLPADSCSFPVWEPFAVFICSLSWDSCLGAWWERQIINVTGRCKSLRFTLSILLAVYIGSLTVIFWLCAARHLQWESVPRQGCIAFFGHCLYVDGGQQQHKPSDIWFEAVDGSSIPAKNAAEYLGLGSLLIQCLQYIPPEMKLSSRTLSRIRYYRLYSI